MTSRGLQYAVDKLREYRHEDEIKMKVCGACTTFIKDIFCFEESSVGATDLAFRPHVFPDITKRVRGILTDWASEKDFIVLMSEHLPLHLNLPVSTYPSDCWHFQILLLGRDLEFIILTLYEGDSVDKPPKSNQLQDFTMRCARMLTFQLLNLCHKEFILLPCTLAYGDFCVETLQGEVQKQLKDVADFYTGPHRLREESYHQLAQGVRIVARGLEVSSSFGGDAGKKLLVCDHQMYEVLRLVIEQLGAKDPAKYPLENIVYAQKTEEKVKMIVLEAARRLIYRQKVTVVSDDKKIQTSVRELADSTYKEYKTDQSKCKTYRSRFQCLTVEDAVSRKLVWWHETAFDTPSEEASASTDAPSESTAGDEAPYKSPSDEEQPPGTMLTSLQTEGAEYSEHDVKETESCEGIASDMISNNWASDDESNLPRATSRNNPARDMDPMETDLAERTSDSLVYNKHIPNPTVGDSVTGMDTNGERIPDSDLHEAMITAELRPKDDQYVLTQASPDESTAIQAKSGEHIPCESLATNAMPSERKEDESEDVCVIVIDTPLFSDHPALRLRLTESHSGSRTSEEEHIRVLLVGKSGSGKSSTANTLMGEDNLFPVGISFSPVTTREKSEVRKIEKYTIEVVELPGIFSLTEPFPSAISARSLRDFDVVCFVVRIGFFAEEDNHVFYRIKEIFGESIVRHMIVIFTGGDKVSMKDFGSLLARAPRCLQKVMEQCQQRHAVFDNIRPRNKRQVHQFLKVTETLRCGKQFSCPSYDSLRRRWENATESNLKLELSKKKRFV